MVDIIKHPNEVDGKSTAVQAATLAPGHVTIYTYPTIPEYDTDKVSDTLAAYLLWSFYAVNAFMFLSIK